MRWVFRLLGLVVVLIALAVGALFLLPAERIAQLAARQFEAATGRQLTIDGKVTPTFWPVLGARVEGVTLANVAGAQGGPMLVADSVDLGVDLSALWGGSVVVRRFEARHPQIVLERDANGQGNWVFSGLGATPDTTVSDSGAGVLPPIALDRAQIEGASLRFIDHQAGTDVTVQGVTLDLSMPEAGGAATLTINVANNGQEAAVRATVGSVEQLLAGQVVPVTASIEASGAQGSFDGRMRVQPVAAEGRITLDIRQLAPLLELAGAGGAEVLPDAARPLTLGGQFTLAPAGSIHLRDGSLGVGVNRLAVALDTTFDGPRPHVSGTISADSLDLSGFTTGGGGGGSGASAPSGGGWPTDRIDASALGLERGTTPLLDLPAVLPLPLRLPGIAEATLSTGGNVVSGAAYDGIAQDMVDMETFAVLRACMTQDLPLIALRGISDGHADLTGLQDWTDYLHIIDEKLAQAVDILAQALAEGLLA